MECKLWELGHILDLVFQQKIQGECGRCLNRRTVTQEELLRVKNIWDIYNDMSVITSQFERKQCEEETLNAGHLQSLGECERGSSRMAAKKEEP